MTFFLLLILGMSDNPTTMLGKSVQRSHGRGNANDLLRTAMPPQRTRGFASSELQKDFLW